MEDLSRSSKNLTNRMADIYPCTYATSLAEPLDEVKEKKLHINPVGIMEPQKFVGSPQGHGDTQWSVYDGAGLKNILIERMIGHRALIAGKILIGL